MKKKIIIILGILVIMIGIATGIIVSKVKRFEAYMRQIEITDIDLSEISDGSYTGLADAGVIKVKVEVIVNGHEIKDIKLLEHKNGQGEDAEVIINDIIKQQKITVDTISGATLSSQVIQEAIQKALESGK